MRLNGAKSINRNYPPGSEVGEPFFPARYVRQPAAGELRRNLLAA